MRIENSYKIIPCYTADVSGVCSALYELGGMIVMHDPSGCNSTYNTHDETRWYDRDSLIYITGLTELDAIMGNDMKVVRDVCDAAARLSPKFIALCGSPIPFLNGTDYHALARIIEKESGISTFAVETNGMHDYIKGAGDAMLCYAKKMLLPSWTEINTQKNKNLSEHDESYPQSSDILNKKAQPVINILGATPLDFAAKNSICSLKSALIHRDINILSIFSAICSENVDNLKFAVLADINLVVSAVGLPLAHYMQERFGIPFIAGIPTGDFADRLCDDIRRAASVNSAVRTASAKPTASKIQSEPFSDKTLYGKSENNAISVISCADPEVRAAAFVFSDNPDADFADRSITDGKLPLALIGEAVTMGSVASAISLKYGIPVSVLCPLEGSASLLCGSDFTFRGEKRCSELMRHFRHVAADPLYLPICPEGTVFHRLPHAAFSGRCLRSEMKDLITLFDEV